MSEQSTISFLLALKFGNFDLAAVVVICEGNENFCRSGTNDFPRRFIPEIFPASGLHVHCFSAIASWRVIPRVDANGNVPALNIAPFTTFRRIFIITH